MGRWKKILIGMATGAATGLIDSAIMVFQKYPINEMISGFAFWVVGGFVIAASDIGIKGAMKGIVISLLLLIPIGIPLVYKNPSCVVSMVPFTALLGAVMGHLIDKY